MKHSSYFEKASQIITTDRFSIENLEAVRAFIHGGEKGDFHCYFCVAAIVARTVDSLVPEMLQQFPELTKESVIKLLEKAAHMGHGLACFHLSLIFEQGTGKDEFSQFKNPNIIDSEKANLWWQRGLDLNDPTCLVCEGERQFKLKNYSDAKQFFKRAKNVKLKDCPYEEQDFFETTCNIDTYLEDIKAAEDTEKKFEQTKRLAEQGNAAACYNLGTSYISGHLGLPKDPSLGRHWIEKAANAGLKQAIDMLKSQKN